MPALRRVELDALEIEDRASFRHVALFDELSRVVRDAKVGFHVPREGSLSWNRATLLNLAFWTDGAAGGDVLTEPSIPADVLMHVAWHHLAATKLEPSVESDILGEAIASAFDLYLIGRLLGHAPDSTFLETQIPALSDVAEAEGASVDAFEETLEACAADPDRAFEDLRALLFDVTRELVAAATVEEAADISARHAARRFGVLLHHYELPTWVLRGRAIRASASSGGSAGRGTRALDVDAELRAAPSSVEWLRERWVLGK